MGLFGENNGGEMESAAIKRDALTKRWTNRKEEYNAVNKQIDAEIDNTKRLVLERQTSHLLEEMEKIESEIKLLDKNNIVGNDNLVTSNSPQLQIFKFEIVKVQIEEIDRSSPEIKMNSRPGQARFFEENLGYGVTLEMVEIPGGTFRMGASQNEVSSRDTERPRHQVTVQPFFIGKYAVTQEQWEKVADFLPKVNRELEPNPSYFKGEKRPVECVSWYDAVEFCARLSKHTGREYRLPSEAEWEYACRAGTTTPFHFGETITTKLANYNGYDTYGNGQKGENRRRTTPVGSFSPNVFGLYDMHGNVWEWCADSWHDSYEGAPTDGRTWIGDNDNRYRLLRGGSWSDYHEHCRSAYRHWYNPDNDYINDGFRVVSVFAPRTLTSP